MNKYKICVYAICKNEESFVARFVKSCEKADGIFVLDTGSTDDTVKKLEELGVVVKTEVIKPWRFDIARNKSIEMIPKDFDICICLDLDEVLINGWRDELEKVWQNDTTRLRYIYNWRLDKDDKPLVSYTGEKIHSRNGYKWIHPVHEVLKYNNEHENVIKTDNLIIHHYPDTTKSRSCYLPLLELAVEEDPSNDRNMHYLGREYMYYQKWNESIDTLIKHLNLETARWKDERSASMRFIARCYDALNRHDEVRMWLDKAIKETPYLRDPLIERAMFEYKFENWDKVINYCNRALEIKTHERTYINELFSWNETIYDLLSLGYYYCNNYEASLKNINLALEIAPNNERLIKNKELINKMI